MKTWKKKNGVMEYWSVGVQRWSIGVLECWSAFFASSSFSSSFSFSSVVLENFLSSALPASRQGRNESSPALQRRDSALARAESRRDDRNISSANIEHRTSNIEHRSEDFPCSLFSPVSKDWKRRTRVFPSIGKTHGYLFQCLEKTRILVSNAWKTLRVARQFYREIFARAVCAGRRASGENFFIQNSLFDILRFTPADGGVGEIRS